MKSKVTLAAVAIIGAAILTSASAQDRLRFSAGVDASGDTARCAVFGSFGGSGQKGIAVFESSPFRVGFRTATAPFAEFNSLAMPFGGNFAVAEDFDGDGDDDLAVSGQSSAAGGQPFQLAIILNHGTSGLSMSSPVTIPALMAVRTFDFEGDGDKDVIAGRTILLNDGQGVFTAGPVLTGAATAAELLPGDFDGDGDNDFAAVYLGDSAAGFGVVTRIFRRNASGTFTLKATQLLTPANFDPSDPSLALRAKVAEMTGDGKADIVASYFPSQSLQRTVGVFAGSTTLTLTSTSTWNTDGNGVEIDVADLDGDGDNDVVQYLRRGDWRSVPIPASNDGLGHLSSFHGHLFSAVYGSELPYGSIDMADVDLDGRPDLLINARPYVTNPAPDPAMGRVRLAYGQPDVNAAAERVRFSERENVVEIVPTNGFQSSTALARPTPILPDRTIAKGQHLTASIIGNATVTLGSPFLDFSSFHYPLYDEYRIQTTVAGNSVLKVQTDDGEEYRLYVACGPTLAYRSGDRQTAAPGEEFAAPLTVKRLAAFNAAVVGEQVTFTSVGGVPVTFSSNDHPHTDALGFARVYVTAGSSIGSALVRATSSSGYTFDFELNVDFHPTIEKVSGDAQAFRIDQPTLEPIVCRVLDANGQPAVGEFVHFEVESGASVKLPITTILPTNAAGEVAINLTLDPAGTSGETRIRATTASGPSTTFSIFVRKFNLALGLGVATLFYDHEHPQIPLLLRASAPRSAPGYVETAFGKVYTEFSNPGVDFVYLDGWGYYGAPDLSLITNSSGTWSRSFSIPVPPIGIPFVLQMEAYDYNYEYPANIVFSNPVNFTY